MIQIRSLKFAESPFATEEFQALDRYRQAEVVFEKQDILGGMSSRGLDAVADILLRSMCYCRLIETVIDESTGETIRLEKSGKNLKHDRNCPVYRIPCNEDLSPKQLLRRQRLEVLCENSYFTLIEEESAGTRTRSRVTSE